MAGSAPAPTVRATAASPATTARSATVGAWLASTEMAAGKSVHAAGKTNLVTTELGSARGVTQDGWDPGGSFKQHVAIQTMKPSAQSH